MSPPANPRVSSIELRRPERLNAMSFELVGPLEEAIGSVSADNDTWVVILKGAGGGFCSGLDLDPPGERAFSAWACRRA